MPEDQCYRNGCYRAALDGSSFCYDHGGRVQSVPPAQPAPTKENA